jgi:hypothetical protein
MANAIRAARRARKNERQGVTRTVNSSFTILLAQIESLTAHSAPEARAPIKPFQLLKLTGLGYPPVKPNHKSSYGCCGASILLDIFCAAHIKARQRRSSCSPGGGWRGAI